MRKVIILLTLLFCNQLILSQNSGFTEVDKLAATAKIWGFLKYYHPQVADGKFDWDAQLFEILPKVRKSNNKQELSEVYLNWIGELGKVKDCRKCAKENKHDYFGKNFDLSWIDNEIFFSKKLTEKLRFIENNRHQGKKHYVSTRRKVKNIEITNEKSYDAVTSWKREDYRLLNLFRYWNIIEYFFPYKYQTDTPWDKVLTQMIPKFLNPTSETDYHLAMLELIVKIDDSHGFLYTEKTNEFFGLKWIPAHFKLHNNQAIISGFYDDSLAKINDIRIGDIITKVDGKDVESIFNENKKYINGSNLARKRANSFRAIFNGKSDSVRVEYLRDGKCYNSTWGRYETSELNVSRDDEQENYKILEGNLGYVNMGVLKIKEIPDMMEDLQDTKSLILDIRNYPNGTLYYLAKYITSTRNDFYKVTYPDLDYPGKFIWKDGNQCGKNTDLKYTGNVVLLVNEKTQSHAEFTAMCLQTGDNVITMGSQTSGADGNVSKLKMLGGYKTMISGIGIFYPDGTETQRTGIKVDVEVKPSTAGIVEGRDEVLEKAIEYLNTSTN